MPFEHSLSISSTLYNHPSGHDCKGEQTAILHHQKPVQVRGIASRVLDLTEFGRQGRFGRRLKTRAHSGQLQHRTTAAE